MTLPCILKTICWTNVIIPILDPCDAKINHIKCMWISDLHFMVQEVRGMLDWRYWFSVTLRVTYKYIRRPVIYSLWYSDSALYFQYYLMNKPHSLDIGSDMCYWPVWTQLVNGSIPVWICDIGQSTWDILLNYSQRIFGAVTYVSTAWLSEL